jgi:hypothetical protein
MTLVLPRGLYLGRHSRYLMVQRGLEDVVSLWVIEM